MRNSLGRMVAWVCFGLVLDMALLGATAPLSLTLWMTVLSFRQALFSGIVTVFSVICCVHFGLLPGLIWPARPVTPRDLKDTLLLTVAAAGVASLAMTAEPHIAESVTLLFTPLVGMPASRGILLAVLFVAMAPACFAGVAWINRVISPGSALRVRDAAIGGTLGGVVYWLALLASSHAEPPTQTNGGVWSVSDALVMVAVVAPHLALESLHVRPPHPPRAAFSTAARRMIIVFITVVGAGVVLWVATAVMFWVRLLSLLFHS